MRRFGFVDVTLRDAHQCLWSTRMTHGDDGADPLRRSTASATT